MTSRAFRPIVATLSILLLTGVPVHAGPVAIKEVIQVLGTYQNPPEIRLRTLTQTSSTPISEIKGSTIVDNSLLAGVAVSANDPQRGVEIIDQGDVEGTICDCGEILIAGGGFPKWPLLFLAAIPLFFINGDDDFDTPTFTTTPTPLPAIPTPTPSVIPIPEPASLLLFGSGLAAFGAGLRRRYKTKSALQGDAAKEA